MRRPPRKLDSQSPAGYHRSMSGENDHELINFIATTVETMRGHMGDMREQMATKDDIVRLESRIEIMRERMDTMGDQMATKDDIVRLESKMETMDARTTAIQGDIEQVHIRLDSLDRRLDTRVGQVETDVSRIRSVVYLLVKDRPDMLRILGQPTPRENPRRE